MKKKTTPNIHAVETTAPTTEIIKYTLKLPTGFTKTKTREKTNAGRKKINCAIKGMVINNEKTSPPLTSPINDEFLNTVINIEIKIKGTAATPEKKGHNMNAKKTFIRGYVFNVMVYTLD